MPADIHLTKIVFKSTVNSINYIQFYFSNGSKSPEFEAIRGYKGMEKSVILDELNRPVRYVKGTIA